MDDQSFILGASIILGRLLVGGMLVLAGVLKLKAGPHWFLQQLLAYELIKGKTAWLLARGLPLVEILYGILLIVGFLIPLVVVLSFVLLWGFTAAVISTFFRGKPVDCGCFGRRNNPKAHQARWTVAYRNLSLMVVLAAISTANITSLSLDTLLNNWRYYSPIAAKWLITIWVGSLILTIGLQIWTRRRLIPGDSVNQTTPIPH
jgi:uncharacterized membrane protein YphA (DoxX/SURF4 family)